MIQQSYFWVYIQKNWKQNLKDIFSHVPSSITNNIQKVYKATQVYTERWMDRQNVSHPLKWNIIQLFQRKEF